MDSNYGASDAPEIRSRKLRNALAIVLLVVTSYEMGLSHSRSEKRISEYTALKAQYDRIESECSTLRTQYTELQSEYSALRAEYSRFERQSSNTATKPAKKM